jgi:hypothetical protein
MLQRDTITAEARGQTGNSASTPRTNAEMKHQEFAFTMDGISALYLGAPAAVAGAEMGRIVAI